MKKLFITLLVFISIFCSLTFKSVKKINAERNTLTSEIVIDAKTNRVLYQKNINEKMFMASTTKILTAICVIENCNINNIVSISKDSVGIEGSSIYLEEGERLSVKDLLYGLMLRSGNDCAVTLALYCSGSISAFANLMNSTAKRIGAFNSNFTNPHGLHDDNHYTTAYDLAIISSYAMNNKIFREIASTKTIKIPNTLKNYDRILRNKNKMLNEYEGSNGIKTGYTKNAGRCLVTSCSKNGLDLISVVLNCPSMWEVSKSILDKCFNEYRSVKLLESDNIIDFVDVVGEGAKRPIMIKNDVYLPLSENELSNLNIVYDYPKKIEKSMLKDKEIGSVKFFIKNNLIFSEKIYTII